jgi:hypothetical protein
LVLGVVVLGVVVPCAGEFGVVVLFTLLVPLVVVALDDAPMLLVPVAVPAAPAVALPLAVVPLSPVSAAPLAPMPPPLLAFRLLSDEVPVELHAATPKATTVAKISF